MKLSKYYRRLVPYCFWETGAIGINVEDIDGRVVNIYDLTEEDAKVLLEELKIALEQYEQLDEEWKNV